MSEAKNNGKNSFIERLKKLVIRENKDIVKQNPDLEKYIEQEIEKMLKVRGEFVAVTSPEEEKKFRAEVKRSLKKALEEKALANGEKIDTKIKTADSDKTAEEKKRK